MYKDIRFAFKIRLLKKLQMKNWLIFTILSSFLWTSCKNNVIEVNYPDGGIYERYEFKGDSLKHGKYESFLPDGSLFEEAHYIDGQLDGQRTIYKDGKAEIEEHYSSGQMSGAYTVFHPNGNKKLYKEYHNGVVNGTVKGFYPSGAIREEVVFENNIENGPFKEYHENGELKWEGTYLKGDNEFGLLKEYNEQGVLIKKMMCDEDAICTTIWKLENEEK